MKLYKMKSSPESKGYGLMARDDEGYCFVYSASTGVWHRNKSRELDLEFGTEAIYSQIDSAEAAQLIPDVKAANSVTMSRYIEELNQQPALWKRTSADVGITTPSKN